ncbi:MAG: toxin-antitoxin system YwqK family antitoxin [Fusobacterium necrophorum]|nr:toxin-antitoxin system YwqK family antitoxin [Fusobacterium necrophorum]
MKMKQYIGIFFIMSFCLFGEIREITPLSELSNNILGEKAQKTSKVEKNISKISKEQKNTPNMSETTKYSRNISQKDSSQFVDISEQDNRNGVIYRQGENTAFTGVFALFMGDWIQYIETYKNGKLDGESSWYSQNGTQVLLEQYQAGKLHGSQLSYYENGNPKAEVMYDKGRITGVICFAKDGSILHKSIFNNGTGIWKLYWENGNLLETGKYTNFRKDGVWKKYNEDGSLESTLEYRNGKLLKETWG